MGCGTSSEAMASIEVGRGVRPAGAPTPARPRRPPGVQERAPPTDQGKRACLCPRWLRAWACMCVCSIQCRTQCTRSAPRTSPSARPTAGHLEDVRDRRYGLSCAHELHETRADRTAGVNGATVFASVRAEDNVQSSRTRTIRNNRTSILHLWTRATRLRLAGCGRWLAASPPTACEQDSLCPRRSNFSNIGPSISRNPA